MRPLWTGDIVREMHVHEITGKELAKEVGWSEKYLCAVLNGKRTPKKAEETLSAALFRAIFKNDLRRAGRECDLVAELERWRARDPEYAQRLSKALGLEETEVQPANNPSVHRTSTFAKRLRELLHDTGWTQTELAAKTGISKSSINHYLKGDWEGKYGAMRAIACAANVSEEWLAGYDCVKEREEEHHA